MKSYEAAIMKHIVLAATAVMAFLVAPCHAQVTGAAPRYAVVKIVNYDKSETNQVMSAAEFQALKAEIQAEAPLFARAMSAAANEWKDDELLRKQKFPSAALGTRQAAVIGPQYDSQEKASAALNALLANKARMQPTRQQSKVGSEKDRVVAQALELLVEQLDDMKSASQPGESAETATNKIALTAGQVLTRTAAGATEATYHIAVPDNYNPEKPPPLLVLFSPGGDGQGMMNAVRSSANKVGWMAIGCDKLHNDMTLDECVPIEKDLMRDIRTFIPYDQKRLYYGGFSGGAWRAYYMTWRFKDRCAGILAFGGWLGPDEDRKKPFQKHMAVAVVNGDSDQAARAWEEPDANILKHRRCEIKVFHFPGGHAVAPSEVIDQAIGWLDQQASTNNNSKSKSPDKRGM